MARGKRRGRPQKKDVEEEVEQEQEQEGMEEQDTEEFETDDLDTGGDGDDDGDVTLDDALLAEDEETAEVKEDASKTEVEDAPKTELETPKSEAEASVTEAEAETPMETQESEPKAESIPVEGKPTETIPALTVAPDADKVEENKKEQTDTKEEEAKGEEEEKKVTPAKKEKKKKKERTKSYELEKYWKAVKTNPADFTGWTYLLQYVEQEDYMPFYREAFDAFFERYPYCYGYWKKYADCERKKGNIEKCWDVFDRGLKAIKLSSDLWLHYISVSSQVIPRTDEDRADKIRALYERAIEAAGMDFRSDKLWDQYLTFEKKENKDWKRVMQLYDRILKIPTQLYRHHFDKFKEFVQAHLPKEYLDFDEFLTLREQVVAEAAPVEAVEVDDDAGPPGDEDAPPGEEAPPGVGASASKVIEGENKLIQEKVVESRRAVFRKTEQEVSKRWAYEEAIRRPYFHAKPLEKGQLKTWREYLDFEETNGSHDRTVLLYERCLIACALYEEFWLKYAKYMESQSLDLAKEVFNRACNIHLPTKPAINIQWAAFEEKNGNVAKAKEILEKLQERQQDSVMIRLERINFERRQGNHEEVIRLYEGCIDDAKTATGQSFFAGKLSRFYQKIVGDHEKALETLQKVLQQKQVSPILKEQIYTQMLDIEYQRMPLREAKMIEIFDNAIGSNINHDTRCQFAQRKIQFLQDFGTNPSDTHDAVDEHQKIVKNQSTGKKRSADASGDAMAPTPTPAPVSETKAPEKKKTKTETTTSANKTNGYSNSNYQQQQQQQQPVAQAVADMGQMSWSSWADWGNFAGQ